MVQVMEMSALDAGFFQSAAPSRPEFIRTVNSVPHGLTPEDQARIQRARRIVECDAKDFHCLSDKGDGSSRSWYP